jgi:flavin-dependent dehydrogenase
MSFDYDIAIVGGGPAGTSTALHLARAEKIDPSRVLVLDKAVHPREKPCAGAISTWGLAALAAIDVAVDVPNAVMRGVRLLRGDEIGVHAGDELGVVVRRSEFDAMLWRRAREDGVHASDGEGLVALERVREGYRLTTDRRSVVVRLVAACDGAGSTTRKLLGLREPARKGHLYVLETPMRDADEGVAKGLCDFDLTPCAEGVEGYYWDFPTVIDGRPYVSRGIYHANFTPGRVKDALASALARRGIDIASVKLKPFSTRPFVRASTLWLRHLAFVGEAAGIDATTGEGIAQAILFGEIAARHLAAALRRGDGDLRSYEREIRGSRVARHLLQSAWMAERVYGPRRAMWQNFLLRSPAARAAGVAWYRGESLPLSEKARLALGLLREGIRGVAA